MTGMVKEAHEYWNDSKNELVRLNSHWRGYGRITDHMWRKMGSDDMIRIQKSTGWTLEQMKKKTILDYGCGGGSKMYAASKVFEKCIGVDISPANLEECARQLKFENATNFETCLVPIDNPESTLGQYKGRVDVVLCTGVFYHMPSQDYVRHAIKVIYDLLKVKPKSYLVGQFRESGGLYTTKTKHYRRNVTTITTFTKEAFETMVKQIGFKSCTFFDRIDEINYQYFMLEK